MYSLVSISRHPTVTIDQPRSGEIGHTLTVTVEDLFIGPAHDIYRIVCRN